VPLPNWLDDTLATLPPSHPVRRLLLPLDRYIVRDFVDQNPDVSDEVAVFAFQAPCCESHPLRHAGSDGHFGAMVAVTVPEPSSLNSELCQDAPHSHKNPFEATYKEPVGIRKKSLAMSRTVPFSTPGPSCAMSRVQEARCPWGAFTTLSRTMDNYSQEDVDVPPPFSTPGPFASPRPVCGHVFANHSAATSHKPLYEVYPTVQESSTVPVLSSCATSCVDTLSLPVQDGRGEFSASPNVSPNFMSNNLGGFSLHLAFLSLYCN